MLKNQTLYSLQHQNNNSQLNKQQFNNQKSLKDIVKKIGFWKTFKMKS